MKDQLIAQFQRQTGALPARSMMPAVEAETRNAANGPVRRPQPRAKTLDQLNPDEMFDVVVNEI